MQFFLNFSKMRIYFPINNFVPFALFKVEGKEIKEFIPLKDLIKINNTFKKGSFSLFFNLLKNKELRTVLLKFAIKIFNLKNFNKYLRDQRILFLYAGVVNTPITYSRSESDTIGIQKYDNKIEYSKPSFETT